MNLTCSLICVIVFCVLVLVCFCLIIKQQRKKIERIEEERNEAQEQRDYYRRRIEAVEKAQSEAQEQKKKINSGTHADRIDNCIDILRNGKSKAGK